jgi:hypothetical protein
MSHRWLFTAFYALHIIWTGLWRSVEAQTFKPNAFWFCLSMGMAALVGAYLYRIQIPRIATLVAAGVTLIVLTFYLFSFITNSEQDASFRVALIILTSIAELVVILFLSRTKI